MARVVPVLAVVSLAGLLTGCPSSYGFIVNVQSEKNTPVKVLAMRPSSLGPNDLAPIPGARISCAPCDAPDSTSNSEGTGFLAFGMGYSSPDPIVVKITSPGYLPVEFALAEIPHDSSLGYGAFTVVMTPDPNAAKPAPTPASSATPALAPPAPAAPPTPATTAPVP